MRINVFVVSIPSSLPLPFQVLPYLVDHADHVIEPIHFLRTSNAQWGPLIDGSDLNVEDGSSCDTVGGFTSGLLDEEGEGGGFEGEAELCGGGFGGGVGEDALVLGELLVDVGDEASGVAEGVFVGHVVVEQGLRGGEGVVGGERSEPC